MEKKWQSHPTQWSKHYQSSYLILLKTESSSLFTPARVWVFWRNSCDMRWKFPSDRAFRPDSFSFAISNVSSLLVQEISFNRWSCGLCMYCAPNLHRLNKRSNMHEYSNTAEKPNKFNPMVKWWPGVCTFPVHCSKFHDLTIHFQIFSWKKKTAYRIPTSSQLSLENILHFWCGVHWCSPTSTSWDSKSQPLTPNSSLGHAVEGGYLRRWHMLASFPVQFLFFGLCWQ